MSVFCLLSLSLQWYPAIYGTAAGHHWIVQRRGRLWPLQAGHAAAGRWRCQRRQQAQRQRSSRVWACQWGGGGKPTGSVPPAARGGSDGASGGGGSGDSGSGDGSERSLRSAIETLEALLNLAEKQQEAERELPQAAEAATPAAAIPPQASTWMLLWEGLGGCFSAAEGASAFAI